MAPTDRPGRVLLGAAGLSGLLAVIAGALGAHALGLDDAARRTWQSANLFHLVHSVAILGVAVLPGRGRVPAGVAFMAGIILFSGSLYLRGLGIPVVVAGAGRGPGVHARLARCGGMRRARPRPGPGLIRPGGLRAGIRRSA